MLILTHRVGERILIGDEVVVTVLEVRNRQVRIGIQAPLAVTVRREEIYRRLRDASRAPSR